MDELELRNLMYTAQLPNKGPFAIRYPRGSGVINELDRDFTEIPIGKGRKMAEGNSVAILSIGHPGNFVSEAIKILSDENISVAHYDMRFVVPIDKEILKEVAIRFDHIITVEDGIISGGFGSAVLEYFASEGSLKSIVRLGVPDRFVEQGTQQELYHECGFDAEGICKTVRNILMC
jgi:1-deoxy-D-xylulose-5-phosphate synthase